MSNLRFVYGVDEGLAAPLQGEGGRGLTMRCRQPSHRAAEERRAVPGRAHSQHHSPPAALRHGTSSNSAFPGQKLADIADVSFPRSKFRLADRAPGARARSDPALRQACGVRERNRLYRLRPGAALPSAECISRLQQSVWRSCQFRQIKPSGEAERSFGAQMLSPRKLRILRVRRRLRPFRKWPNRRTLHYGVMRDIVQAAAPSPS